MTLTVGSLFSGIGGLDLGLERAGMTVRWQSEIDPYCCRVLAKHWPHVPNLGDIKTIDWKKVEPVDLICGGYPCQPFSLAGIRRGESDPRHLWPWFRDTLRVVRPRLALLENVPGHLGLGFDTVLRDLAELGYDTEWDCIPAAAVGAPHLRYRVFVVAYATSGFRADEPRRAATQRAQPLGGSRPGTSGRSDGGDSPSRTGLDERPSSAVASDVPDTERDGLQQQPNTVAGRSHPTLTAVDGADGHVANTDGEGRRTGRPVGGGDGPADRQRTHDLPRRDAAWAVEPDVGRVAYGVPHRVDRLRALGNAVVPQVAEWIGRRILEAAA